MIKLIFGNVGSGKTASMVRYMKMNPQKMFITNIHVHGRGFKHVIPLKADMLINKEVTGHKRDGKETYKLKLNVQFWKDLIEKHGEMNIIIDEAHVFFNPRRSMSQRNIIATDFLALLRRVLGSSSGHGELILITQLSRRLDVIAKEMATDVSYCVHHYITECSRCHAKWSETNETANKFLTCPRCHDYRTKRIKSQIEIFDFKNVDAFMQFKDMRIRTYYRRYYINDIESVFGNYDTIQFDDILSEY